MTRTRRCPRCGQTYSTLTRDASRSRIDGATEICARCAIDETMIAANRGYTRIHPVTGLRPWVNQVAAGRALSMASHPSFRGAPE